MRLDPHSDVAERLPTRRSGSRRRIATALLVIAAGAALGVLYGRSGEGHREPPQVPLTDSHRLVAAAIDEARRAVIADPRSPAVWGAYGMCLYAHGFTEAALVSFSQAQTLDPDDYRWPYLCGLVATFTDPQRGRECFERASQLRPGAVFVRLRTAELLLDLHQSHEASDHIEAALALEPDNPRALLVAAQLAFVQGDLLHSRTLAAGALQKIPTLPAAAELLARICFQLGDEPAARQYQRQVRGDGASHTNWPDPLYAQVMQQRQDPQWLLAHLQQQRDRGQTTTAQAQLQRALERDPDLLEFRLELIQSLLEQGANDEADGLLREGLQRHRTSARLLRMRGVRHYQQGDFQSAAADFREAIDCKQDYGLAYANLGECLYRTGDAPAALEALERALRLQPDLPHIAERIEQIRSEHP